ncbi:disintegrin and metalloproteinase domain-containing protein 1-like [Plakobranchus ocellatus]|uniref:Disintegrin and metalloproteinase domain-containing protein 1-like n=1 Tax=Plakobranchus ocellatus TaxID=259542 RepID=A0AAV4D9R7_9GAST|nr:disintegrin and metalloproteinase domain-containing protein 1-like [Plakobranchus ocellatus]
MVYLELENPKTTIEHCYYHGEVKKDEWSKVAVSTCNGIRGVIQMRNETYVIQPLSKKEGEKDHPHVIFKASASPDEQCGNSQGLWSPFQELYQGELTRKTKFIKARQKMYQNVNSSKKLLRIGLVVDKLLFMGVKWSHQNVIEYAVDIANIMDMYYRELDFYVALTYLELWSRNNLFPVQASHRALLSRFLDYRDKHLPVNDFDAAFFVTGVELDHKKAGVAIPDSICSNRSVAIIKSGRVFEPQQTATILSHMAGHILGIQHDEDGDCVCSDPFGCIMSTEVLGRKGYHSRMFSTCSHSDLEGGLNTGIASCLWGAPKVQTDFTQTCGNSLIERGEECDCGSSEECKFQDPCCDPSTCLLQPWAQCRSGPCCKNCSFLTSDHMCRSRQSECDVPEYCNGMSGNCPSNTYIEDGHPCAKGKGYCVGGICPAVEEQCEGIWGAGAKAGHDQCFENFNPTGNFNGHCGKDKETGTYAKCPYSDIMCGLLHCEGGKSSPLYSSDKGFAVTKINANNNEYECKTVHGPAMMNIPYMGMVKDGTKCGKNKICRGNACVQLPFNPSFDCPTSDPAVICSGNGVCAPSRQCFCNVGWEGPQCSTPSNETGMEYGFKETSKSKTLLPPSLNSYSSDPKIQRGKVGVGSSVLTGAMDTAQLPEVSKLGETNTPATSPVQEDGGGISTTMLIIILATVVAALVLCLGITLLCYRRRSPSKASQTDCKDGKRRCKKVKKGKKGQSTSEEESELGEMPAPPIIISNPDSAVPGRGILKKSGICLMSVNAAGYTGLDTTKAYIYEDDDDEDDEEEDTNGNHEVCDDDSEIQDIFGDSGDAEDGGSTEHMNQLQESASFDFMIPPPPPTLPEPHYYSTLTEPQPQAPPTWRTPLPPQTLSPPQSRIIKLRNLSDFHQQGNIDLSPSPEDEDHPLVRHLGQQSSKKGTQTSSLHSPSSSQGSSASSGNQACAESRPNLGSLSHYILGDAGGKKQQQHQLQQMQQHNNLNLGRGSPLHQSQDQDMPPPMNPINIRTILGGLHNHNHNLSCNNHNQQHHNYPQHSGTPGSTVSRDSNTSLHMTSGSFGCPESIANNANGGENHYGTGTSGYSSEHDPGELMMMPSLSSRSHSLSRSHSGSPPSYSAVIRTGPNRIQLVPATGGYEGCRDGAEGREIEGIQQELNKLLENLPCIDAGPYTRSPLSHVGTSGTLPPGCLAMSQGSSPGTPLTGRPTLPQGSSPGTPPMARSTLSQGSFSASPLLSRQPNREESGDSGAPCIDCSLEEIPAHFTDKKSRTGDRSKKKKRPISVAVQGSQNLCGSDNSLDDGQKHSTAETIPQKV